MKFDLKNVGIEPVNQGMNTGTGWLDTHGDESTSYSPIDGAAIAKVKNATLGDYNKLMTKAEEAFLQWRIVPAPKRGDVVRQIGEALRRRKEELGYLVSLEMGKIYEEGLGEVQVMIGICDFAVGQSRLLNGATMHPREHPFFHHPGLCVGLEFDAGCHRRRCRDLETQFQNTPLRHRRPKHHFRDPQEE